VPEYVLLVINVDHLRVVASVVIALLWFLLFWFNRLPSMSAFIDAANVLNSKGGNLLLLAMMSSWFFYEALRFSYHLIDLMIANKLTANNAIALSMFSFVTGTAFGGAFGALLKGMSGETLTSTGASTVKEDTTITKIIVTPAEEPKP
jgi:hypothetical protein